MIRSATFSSLDVLCDLVVSSSFSTLLKSLSSISIEFEYESSSELLRIGYFDLNTSPNSVTRSEASSLKVSFEYKFVIKIGSLKQFTQIVVHVSRQNCIWLKHGFFN